MDLRRLRYFVAVADHGGFTAAARELFVSQPALSLAVKELEAELGARLFDRLGRRTVLTAAGRALLVPARQTLRDEATGRAAVAAVVGLQEGSLTLCCLPTLAVDPLAELIGRFRGTHPGVRIDLAAPDDAAGVAALLRSGECELGVAESGDGGADLEHHDLGAQRLWCIFPPDVAAGRSSGLGVLDGVPLITTPEGTSTRRLLDEGLARAGVVPTLSVITAQRDAVLPLVLAGAGAALVPERQAQVAEQLGAVVVRPDPPVERRLAVLHRPGPLAPAAQRFLELVTSPGRPSAGSTTD